MLKLPLAEFLPTCGLAPALVAAVRAALPLVGSVAPAAEQLRAAGGNKYGSLARIKEQTAYVHTASLTRLEAGLVIQTAELAFELAPLYGIPAAALVAASWELAA